MTTQISISYSTLLQAAQRYISLVAKRATDKEGHSLFSQMTFSTAENNAIKEMVKHGVSEGVVAVIDVIQGYRLVGDMAAFRVTNSRSEQFDDTAFAATFQALFVNYVAAYTAYDFLSSLQPQLAQKLLTDAATRLSTLKRLVYHKKESVDTADYASVTGTSELL